ncbi:MAG TPA: hypothetical protein VGR16_00970 [Thermomicrobiales bacterium]|nr:hypothetical protein [Thermomicrobiales bacterium]
MPRRSGFSKYDPLRAYLAGLSEDRVTLTFAEIERIIGAALPASAWRAPFWANTATSWGSSVQATTWRRAGWRVAGTHLSGSSPAVTFERLPLDSSGQLPARPRRSPPLS